MKAMLLIVTFLSMILVSCVSSDARDESEPASTQVKTSPEPVLPPEPIPIPESTLPPKPALSPEPAPEIQPTLAPEPVLPSETALEPQESQEENSYKVTQEIYERAFNEIEELILELNRVISKKQYDRWTTYLSNAYKATYNNQTRLNEINRYPQLKDHGIVLRSLKDYFEWVVVPSRSRAVLEGISFVSESQVIAYTLFEGKRAKLYELEYTEDKWNITVW